ncbi:group II intron reverse transcriptase/maturase [Solimicrobium silvestre]|uniref:RNA-directed DNA polymerase n=1 Tax=Solimicrobium silvestre TaxID=2099400 RepID=A0A2S9GWR6_9BURK|nr:group II intron reverse transcriptase/maturase [Solimicrobium silvestre]PRC92167.1 Reverse transcriptase (RNA-dependent DNA polymerase) [Solimicrobium silvestre]
MKQVKPFVISKREVWQAYKQVKANRGAAGVDGETIDQFEQDLSKNLYRLWNRLSSGSYLPRPVRRVEIPKSDGKTRPLGIPTVADRIAQMVVKNILEPQLEPIFHRNSYGYRPNRSAHEAVGCVRQRCRNIDWVVDLDIKGFFDNIDHELLMRAVRKHTDCRWVLLYIERWLTAPVQMPDGSLVTNTGKGTPQGGVISPLLANLFLHYAFDRWMDKHFPDLPFARYADDVICHCFSKTQANMLRRAVQKRLAECKLELHPDKTKIVYCKDEARRGRHPVYKFDFLGFEFRPRWVRNRQRGTIFARFTPAVSPKACKTMRQTIRSWRLHLQTGSSLDEVVQRIRPILNGWIQYYGRFNRGLLINALATINLYLVRWAMRKYKRLRYSYAKGWQWMMRLCARQPDLLPIWLPSQG